MRTEFVLKVSMTNSQKEQKLFPIKARRKKYNEPFLMTKFEFVILPPRTRFWETKNSPPDISRRGLFCFYFFATT